MTRSISLAKAEYAFREELKSGAYTCASKFDYTSKTWTVPISFIHTWRPIPKMVLLAGGRDPGTATPSSNRRERDYQKIEMEVNCMKTNGVNSKDVGFVQRDRWSYSIQFFKNRPQIMHYFSSQLPSHSNSSTSFVPYYLQVIQSRFGASQPFQRAEAAEFK
ncbi:hypothetical protein VNO77_41356 [Canavalia gladiata]|uniref:Uncharacterized protein n=1 Tax=Canavalia gladiata TaxID=3824 RepID=A0AAN9K1M7_CANGL